jgi:hypothetical protein
MLRIIGGLLVVAVSFGASLWAMDTIWPREQRSLAPVLAALPALQPVTRTSVVIAPTAISLTAIRDAMEAAAPRDLTGKRDNPLSKLLSNADIGWTVARGPLALAGRSDGLTVSTALNGTLRVTGQIGDKVSALGGSITGLLSPDVGRSVANVTGKALDQRANVRGNVTILSRPAITSTWRLEPNLTGQVALANSALTVVGMKINVSNEVKPLLDRQVAEQIDALQARLRNDPFLERAARREWNRMCRAIPLGGAAPGMPNLWLELRPTRAFSAQPLIDDRAVTLTIGVQAETRIVPDQTKPNCPFPQRLDIGPQLDQGRVNIALPIDLPFTEVNRLLEAQLKGRTFPDDGSGTIEATVQRAAVSASGDRLLISLQVKARERASWFGFGTEAAIHIWGRPVLDRDQQMLRLTDMSLALESEGAFGLVGTAARAAMPYLQAALARNAVIDLKPFAANARKSIEDAIADFRKQSDGVRVDAAISTLRLSGIAFDSDTLRVIAEADGNARVAISKLP